MEKKRYTILIADDDKDFREIIKTKLQAAGFNVNEAKDGEDALSKMQELIPDLVFLDLEMPSLNGVEVFLKMKTIPALNHIKAVFLTAYGDPSSEMGWLDEKFARDLGAIDYVKKTEDINKIVQIAKLILRIENSSR